MNASYKFIFPLSDDVIKRKTDNFIGYDKLICEIKKISDIIFGNKNKIPVNVLNYFSINGNVILYGKPGVGKTSISYKIALDVLNEYGIKSYQLSTADIIETNLGKTTSNIKSAIEEIKSISKEYGALLILDEVDRLFIDRENDKEISELKRMLIEFMDFLDNLTINDKVMIIGITNLISILDSAFTRRFIFQYEIKNDEKVLYELIKDSNKLLSIEMSEKDLKHYAKLFYKKEKTCDFVKSVYRKEILNSFDKPKELKNNIIKNLKKWRTKLCLCQ